jgi:hypothetical protein
MRMEESSSSESEAGDFQPSPSSTPREGRQESVAPGGISDQPIASAKNDALGFEPYVDAVANFLTDDSTKPPLTMSIEGEWGSGKSSFMKMLAEKLRGKKERTIEFNAWRHDKADSLWSAFALQLNRKLAKDLPIHRRIWAEMALFVRRFRFWEGWFDAVRMLALLAFFVACASVVWILAKNHGSEATRAVIESITKKADSTAKLPAASPTVSPAVEESSADSTVRNIKWPIRIAGLAAAVALVISFLSKFKELFGNPFSIDLAKYARSPKYEDQISFIEQFHDDFAKIVGTYVKEQERVFVFIDDLDRCEVPKAADLVQGLNLLISDIGNFIFIIGMDREKVAAALAIKFEKALPYLAPKLKITDSREDSTLGGLAFGYGFIEKFVQVPFGVPHPVREMERFFRSLSSDSDETQPPPAAPTEPEREAFALEVKNDSPKVRQTGLALAPAFDYNPRKLKQFLNLFRLKAFIAFRTGLFSGESALTLEQLGKFVTISLRWPLLFSDVAENPNLLAQLERIAIARSPTNESEVFEHSESPIAREGEEPFNRWTDGSALEEFLCVEMAGPRKIRPEWSFADVDIPKLLRVSPVVKSTARAATVEADREAEMQRSESSAARPRKKVSS